MEKTSHQEWSKFPASYQTCVKNAAPEIKRASLALTSISDAGTFEGYASLFNVADLGRDIVLPGAFCASLRKRGAGGVKLLWQHNPAEPIGVWQSIVEDGKGLKVRGRLNLAVARAREILSLMREGVVDGLSIGFRTERAINDAKTGLRHLQRLDLWEISLVTFPMLPQARVTGVKHIHTETDAMSGAFQGLEIRHARLRYRAAAKQIESKLQEMGLRQQQYF